MKNAHTEQRPDEHWLGNTVAANWPPEHLQCLKTARLGEIAYDIDRKRLPDSYGMKPLFVHDSEYETYNRIMEARLSAIRSGKVR